MLLALSTFFRTSLSLDPSADVTLAEEIDLQRLYLDIEKARFPDRLHVEIDVPHELEQARLPALILQPIVENAIKYGVSKSRKAVVIRIEARHLDDGRMVARDQQPAEERRQGRASGRHARGNGPRPCQCLPAARGAVRQPRELPLRPDDRRRVQGFAHNAGGDSMAETKPLRVLIADDEPLAAERLQLLLARAEGAQLVGTASDGEVAINLTEALHPDLLLLDIAMPGLDGIGVARALAAQNPSPAVVFVTAFDQFAVAAFEVEAVDYLMKPVDPQPAAARARPRPRLSRSSARASRRAGKSSQWLEEFWASDLSGLVRIAARDVDRVSAERDYMRLHVGRRSWLIHHSMTALEEGLDPELFVRLHRSAIVRKDFITGFTRNPSGRWIARLADGEEQPVGRLYSDRVRAIAGR